MMSPDTLPQKICGEILAFSLVCLKSLFSLATVILSGKNNTYLAYTWIVSAFFGIHAEYQMVVILFWGIPVF